MKWNAWGDPAAGETAVRRHSDAAEAGARRRRRRRCPNSSPSRSGCGRRRCRPPTATRWPTIVGAEYCGVDDRARLLRAGGKSTLDLLRRKDPGVQDAPDAVLLPGDEDEVAAILRFCAAAQHRGRPVRRRHQRGRRPRSDPRRLQGRDLAGPAPAEPTALARRGVRRSRAGRRASPGRTPNGLLGERGFSLGHFPQSFQFATIGGFAATRSSGPGLGGLRPVRRHGPRPAHGDACRACSTSAARRSRRRARTCAS